MKLYAPEYYKSFHCIADKCQHSCCIGWEIDVDGDAMQKYASCTEKYGEEIRNSIDSEGSPHFRLSEGERCPHLNAQGLCKIILELGEDYLCHICRTHPRFFNYTANGKEIGIGLSCEEACRLILTSDAYDKIVCIGEIGEEDLSDTDFDATVHRERLYSILKNRSLPYKDRLRQIYDEYGTSPTLRTDAEWRELLSDLEYLDESHRELFVSSYSSELSDCGMHDEILERALAYLIFRHCSEAFDEGDLRARLGFCLMCERLLASLIHGKADFDDACDLARIFSEEIEYSEDNTQAIIFELEIF